MHWEVHNVLQMEITDTSGEHMLYHFHYVAEIACLVTHIYEMLVNRNRWEKKGSLPLRQNSIGYQWVEEP